MKAAFLAIGNELLDGSVVETNSVFLARSLAESGIILSEKIVVDDTPGSITRALDHLSGYDCIIITGGLGPTEDDRTRESVASYFKRELTEDAEIIADLGRKFAAMRISQIPAQNYKQAMVISGSIIIPNSRGTAPGFIVDDKKIIAAFPGVPYEFESMFPFFKEYLLKKGIVASDRTSVFLKTVGIPESKLDEELSCEANENLSIGTIASSGFVTARLDFTGISHEDALARAKKILSCHNSIERKCYSTDRDATLASAVCDLFRQKGWSLSLAESCTGGLLSSMITDVPGSSDFFIGEVTSYANKVKSDLLNVSGETLSTHGAVSFECAAEMAQGARKLFSTDYALSITGIAGPSGGTADKPVGTVFISISDTNKTITGHFSFRGTRSVIRNRSANRALEMLWEMIAYGEPDIETMTGFVEKR